MLAWLTMHTGWLVLISVILAVWSSDPVAKYFPSGLNTFEGILSPCLTVLIISPVSILFIWAVFSDDSVFSHDSVTKYLPSGLNVTELAYILCAPKLR
jgi:hypothetical protein